MDRMGRKDEGGRMKDEGKRLCLHFILPPSSFSFILSILVNFAVLESFG
jgi:hypothetical protein